MVEEKCSRCLYEVTILQLQYGQPITLKILRNAWTLFADHEERAVFDVVGYVAPGTLKKKNLRRAHYESL